MNPRANSWRRQLAVKARQDRTIVEYLQLKRPEVYNEAVEYYNTLNKKYPSKLDLRKTDEFHALRASVNGETQSKRKTRRTYAKRTFPDITKTIPVKNPAQETIVVLEDNMQLNIPLISYPDKGTTEPSESSKIDREIEEIMDELKHDPILASFFQTPSEPTETPSEPTETPSEPTETPSEPTETPSEPTETPSEPTEIPSEPTETPSEPTETPSEPTEIPFEPTDIVIEPAEIVIDIQPTITEEIPKRVIAEIVADLQEDPHLELIFDEMDIDIEIPTYSPLEEELLSW